MRKWRRDHILTGEGSPWLKSLQTTSIRSCRSTAFRLSCGGRQRPISRHNFRQEGQMLQTDSAGSISSDDLTVVPLGQDYPEIRQTIRSICAKFPGAYWRDLEDRHEYPEAFVK